MPRKSDTDRRDAWWLDDLTSILIVGLVIIGALAVLGAFAYGVATGSIQLNADIEFTGTIPVGTIVMAVLAGLAWMVYVAFTDIYGSKDVEQATEELQDIRDDGD